MKQDRIFRKGGRVWITLFQDTKLLLDWLDDPRCPLTNRQLRRRVCEYLYGKFNMTVEEIVTKTCAPNTLNPEQRDRRAEKVKRAKTLTKGQEFERERNRVARSPIWSPRLSESVRYRKMAAMVRGE